MIYITSIQNPKTRKNLSNNNYTTQNNNKCIPCVSRTDSCKYKINTVNVNLFTIMMIDTKEEKCRGKSYSDWIMRQYKSTDPKHQITGR